jgi:hypothetical protein
MYHYAFRRGEKTYNYYACRNAMFNQDLCSARMIRAELLQESLEHALLKAIGNIEVQEEVAIKGHNYTEEIARLGEQAGHLAQKVIVGNATKQDVSLEEALLDEIQAEIRRLAALEPVPDTTGKIKTGETFQERWERLSVPERAGFMRDAGIKVRVKRWKDELPEVAADYLEIDFPDNAVIVWIVKGIYVQVELGRYADLRKLATAA